MNRTMRELVVGSALGMVAGTFLGPAGRARSASPSPPKDITVGTIRAHRLEIVDANGYSRWETGHQPYAITDLGVGIAYAINNKGQIAGETGGHAALWEQGKAQDLGTLPGFMGCRAMAVNNRGQVVGYAYNGREGQRGWATRAFLYADGTMVALPGYVAYDDKALAIDEKGQVVGDSEALAINDKGQVVGRAYNQQNGFHAVLWSNGGMREVNASTYSLAAGINDAGTIVGSAPYINGANATTGTDAFLAGPSPRRYAPLHGIQANASAVNAEGQIAGEAVFPGEHGWHAFLFESNHIIDLGTLGDLNSSALGLNNRGEVVGWSDIRLMESLRAIDEPRHRHAFLCRDGTMVDLNAVVSGKGGSRANGLQLPASGDWNLYAARGINDRGQIVGEGNVHGGQHGFLLTPIAVEAGTQRHRS